MQRRKLYAEIGGMAGMRRRMTQEAACDYLLKWLIRPVYRRGDNLYYETPMTTFRVSVSLMEYQSNATAWLA